jgi:hypothetical protein
MNLLKKLWNFLFGSKEEPVVSIEPVDGLNEEAIELVDHCTTHLRFRRHCLDCLRAVGMM